MGTGEAPAGSIGCMTWCMACSSYPSHFGRAGCWEKPVRAVMKAEDALLLTLPRVRFQDFDAPRPLALAPNHLPPRPLQQHICTTSPASVASRSTPYWATSLEG